MIFAATFCTLLQPTCLTYPMLLSPTQSNASNKINHICLLVSIGATSCTMLQSKLSHLMLLPHTQSNTSNAINHTFHPYSMLNSTFGYFYFLWSILQMMAKNVVIWNIHDCNVFFQKSFHKSILPFLYFRSFWAHLCICITLSVCSSVRTWPKIRLDNNSYLWKYGTFASNC